METETKDLKIPEFSPEAEKKQELYELITKKGPLNDDDNYNKDDKDIQLIIEFKTQIGETQSVLGMMKHLINNKVGPEHSIDMKLTDDYVKFYKDNKVDIHKILLSVEDLYTEADKELFDIEKDLNTNPLYQIKEEEEEEDKVVEDKVVEDKVEEEEEEEEDKVVEDKVVEDKVVEEGDEVEPIVKKPTIVPTKVPTIVPTKVAVVGDEDTVPTVTDTNKENNITTETNQIKEKTNNANVETWHIGIAIACIVIIGAVSYFFLNKNKISPESKNYNNEIIPEEDNPSDL